MVILGKGTLGICQEIVKSLTRGCVNTVDARGVVKLRSRIAIFVVKLGKLATTWDRAKVR